jgi:hypothetical protein
MQRPILLDWFFDSATSRWAITPLAGILHAETLGARKGFLDSAAGREVLPVVQDSDSPPDSDPWEVHAIAVMA